MFETVLGRLQALAQAEGFDPQPGTVIDGELRAYAAGIAWVYDQLTDTREGAFAATAAEENLWRWLTVRGLLPGDTLQETRQKLLARRQMPWGDFSLAGFQQALSDLCGAGATYHCTDGNLELVIPAAGRANWVACCGTGFHPFSMPICRAAGAPGMRWTQTRCRMPFLTGQRCPLIF